MFPAGSLPWQSSRGGHHVGGWGQEVTSCMRMSGRRTRAHPQPERIVCAIQGPCSRCARHSQACSMRAGPAAYQQRQAAAVASAAGVAYKSADRQTNRLCTYGRSKGTSHGCTVHHPVHTVIVHPNAHVSLRDAPLCPTAGWFCRGLNQNAYTRAPLLMRLWNAGDSLQIPDVLLRFTLLYQK